MNEHEPLWYILMDKSLPIIGVIVGAVLSPLIIEVVSRGKEKTEAKANLIELIYRYFSAKRAYYGTVNSIARDRSNHNSLGEKLKRISEDTAEGKLMANDYAILEKLIWEGRERKFELAQLSVDLKSKMFHLATRVQKIYGKDKSKQLIALIRNRMKGDEVEPIYRAAYSSDPNEYSKQLEEGRKIHAQKLDEIREVEESILDEIEKILS